MTYLLIENDEYVTLTEKEWYSLIGEEDIVDYVLQVYQSSIDISEVPEELRERVTQVVNNKIVRWGLYADRQIPSGELEILINSIME